MIKYFIYLIEIVHYVKNIAKSGHKFGKPFLGIRIQKNKINMEINNV